MPGVVRSVGVAIVMSFAFVVSPAAPLGAIAPAPCESLSALALPDTRIFAAQSVRAGSFTPPGAAPVANLPAFCRVTGSIRPSADSDIRFEVWMPAAGWNRKLQGIGNGGFAGSIDFSALGEALSHGYAAAATDTGHAAAGMVETAWALGHSEKVTDFGYRAIHETAVKARALVSAFYGNRPAHAYFSACSNGGRQALMEAQRYPTDYDGIIAGAPANYWTHLLTAAIWDLQVESDPATRVPPAKLASIEAATLAACDKQDGIEDGLIDNPMRCHFDPDALLCRGAETDACLTAAQVTGLRRLYAGPLSSAGKTVFPGHLPGGITGGGGWSTWVTGPSAASASISAQFGAGFFTNIVLGRPVDIRTFSVDRDMKTADDLLAATLNATDPDLKRFARRGGKLIVYHGWSDPAISAVNTVDYYNSVVAKMGAKGTAAFMRVYMAPGLQHCSGGPGPNEFGQNGTPTGNRQHDIAAALEAWVEHGTAPAGVIATKYRSGMNPASGVVRTRPLCPYPQVARWRGTGSTDDAANFTCAAR